MKDREEYIERLIKGELTPDEVNYLEKEIADDPGFAADIALYVSSIDALRARSAAETKERFRKLHKGSNNVVRMPFWKYAAAAAAVITVLFVGVYVFFPRNSPPEIADRYIEKNLAVLGVMMNNAPDSLQRAIALYNEGKLNAAGIYFESIAGRHPDNFKAREYAGIVSLRLENYDNALAHFDTLSKATHLYANPGKFYYSLTLFKRDRPGDVKSARSILQQLADSPGPHQRAARELLKQL